MNIIDIINKKEAGLSLNYDELSFAINGFLSEEVADYQMSSLLMTIAIKGMSKEEIFDLTDIMIKSGNQLDLSKIEGIKVDKHSTGGVGDKVTLVLLPLVASVGVKVPKMSGRGLGHTGGTIDKLSSIPGFKSSLTTAKFIKQVNEIGLAIASQTENLVPADKKIYALRDVSGTVESIPLIASSIMSKKIAAGCDKIVIDLKVGNGALITSMEEAKLLARTMIDLGKANGKETICILTNMDVPLGYAIGNSLEVLESIETLKGKGPDDLRYVVLYLGSMMVSMSKGISFADAKKELEENLDNGKAYDKFLELVKAQDGNIDEIKVADKVVSIKSKKTGFISSIKTERLGEVVRKIGGGRYKKEDKVDYSVGVVLSKKVGDYVIQDEEVLKIYVSDKDINVLEVLDCFEVSDSSGDEQTLVYGFMK